MKKPTSWTFIKISKSKWQARRNDNKLGAKLTVYDNKVVRIYHHATVPEYVIDFARAHLKNDLPKGTVVKP